jgi:hypothetical protein
MATMQDSVSVAANSISANVLSGLLYEFVDDGTLVTVSCTGSATGLRATFIAGVPIADDVAINLQNRFPLVPDDILLSSEVPGGRLILRARNTTAGALTFFWRVDL